MKLCSKNLRENRSLEGKQKIREIHRDNLDCDRIKCPSSYKNPLPFGVGVK
jgi:hypothetical protein